MLFPVRIFLLFAFSHLLFRLVFHSNSIRSLLFLGALGLASCERELLPLDPSLIITGYEIRGTVGDRFGNPIFGVDVTIDYTLEWVDNGPEPPRVYQVPSPGESITIVVAGRDGRTVRVESLGMQAAGPFSYLWNGRDGSGQLALPGVYEVRYQTAAGVRLTYPTLLSGTRVATTDSLGRFTIRDRELPVGYYPVPEYSSSGSVYFGNLRVTNELILGFAIEGIRSYRTVSVRSGQALIFDTRLD